MILHQWIVLGAFAFCMVAVFHLVNMGMWNEAAALVIATACFMLDRAHVLTKEPDEEPGDDED